MLMDRRFESFIFDRQRCCDFRSGRRRLLNEFGFIGRRDNVRLQSTGMREQTSTVLKFELYVVVVLQLSHPVWPAPIRSQLCIFMKEALLVEEHQLTDLEVMRRSFAISI